MLTCPLLLGLLIYYCIIMSDLFYLYLVCQYLDFFSIRQTPQLGNHTHLFYIQETKQQAYYLAFGPTRAS